MKRFLVVSATILVLLGAGGWYVWHNRVVPTSTFNTDPGYYTIGTIGARIKVPANWLYTSDAQQGFAAFISPDFLNAENTKDPFSASPIVSGAVMIIPLFLFEENEPLPVGTVVSLDGQEGDIAHGTSNADDQGPTTEYDRLRLNVDGARYVLFALEYPPGFANAQPVLDAAVASFKFK
ncbi:hypothetical protein H7X87_01000 [Acetobacteraceae bacterium]|nr:hypothetical protein [Candidatus Parcubacteria bacterium]